MASMMAVPSLTFPRTFAIQLTGLVSADKKLGVIRVWYSVCHRPDARTCVLQNEILILKFLSVVGTCYSCHYSG